MTRRKGAVRSSLFAFRQMDASSDTFDKVDLKELKKNEAIMAALVLGLAKAPQRPGPRFTRAQIEATFPSTHLDDAMKGFLLWTEWTSGKRGRTQ